MRETVYYGECESCGGAILYQGARFCSPTCNVVYLDDYRKLDSAERVLALDAETELIRPGRLAPRLVCVSFANSGRCEVVHHTEAREYVVAALESDAVIVGHNIAYDMAVFAEAWPELLPLIFEVYDADRVSDTEVREKLQHIGMGIYRKYERSDGNWVKLNYGLEDVALRRCGIKLEKGEWQLRFGELRDVPVAWWPREALDYALSDTAATLAVWLHQQEDGPELLADEFPQSRAAWWLHLMSCWGLHTDERGVREFARRTQQKYDEIAAELLEVGLLRKKVKKRTGEVRIERNTKLAAAWMLEVKPDAELTPKGKVKLDADCCERSKDEFMQKYAELSSLTKVLSTDVPLLEQGMRVPIQPRFESLLNTGRTSSSPNVQNLPTDVGMRECFVPRPGNVFAAADYSGFELRTWAQVCFSLFNQSKMREALNAGRDPHLEGACRILGISYEDGKAELAAEPLGRVYLARQTMKVANFGYPGGLGPKRFVDYARKSYGVMITENEARKLKDFWFESWPEARLYFEWVGKQCEADVPRMKQLFSNRFRGNVSFTEFANGMFQGLAADAAKAAGFLIARACYAQQESPLYGCRPVDFIHDEFLVEAPDDDRASDVAEELARLMVVGAEDFLPDVPPKAEPYLMRRWSKKAKAVRDQQGKLVPWDLAV